MSADQTAPQSVYLSFGSLVGYLVCFTCSCLLICCQVLNFCDLMTGSLLNSIQIDITFEGRILKILKDISVAYMV